MSLTYKLCELNTVIFFRTKSTQFSNIIGFFAHTKIARKHREAEKYEKTSINTARDNLYFKALGIPGFVFFYTISKEVF